jgi:hypothetical protein
MCLWKYILDSYSFCQIDAVLLGDFELASYQQSPATTWLFFLFTVFGIIILLNVLIAVVSGSCK